MSESALPTVSSLTPTDALLVEDLCTRFEDAWQQGEGEGKRPRIEDYQHEISETAWPVLFRELLVLDVEYRRRHGERPDVDYYAERFPQWKTAIAALLESADSKRVKSIFLAAADKPAAERAALLNKACGSDAVLRRRVEKLLQAHDRSGSQLVPKPAREATTTPPAAPKPKKQGQPLRRYKLLEQIGEGGMGTVWMAEQTAPVKRTVAFKVIKEGMDSKQILARFEAERQAIALMDHPNIAKVFDAGTTAQGRPFFVMELVKGMAITKYCDQHQLTPKERLRLFIQVCQAIQHAHQKGIIHRDIKPSNVLVARYDDKAVPKVIDFGVAKAIGQKLTDKTLFTGLGGLLGTLEYMSPEQAQFNALDIDTRSDIYALGVLLYELLAGSTPITGKRLKKAAIDDALRLIREEEPPKPSTRLSSADDLPSLSANRKTEPAKLTKLIRREPDWIVMKALEKERSRRYETANALARDIDRYLHDEPVEAGPPSASYRLRKLARKHRMPLSVGAAFLAILVVGAVVSAWQAVRATSAETVAVLALDDKAKALTQSQEYAKRLKEEKEASDKMRYNWDMRLAQYAADRKDFERLREILAFHRPQRPSDGDLRGFEWYHWDRLSQTSELLMLKGHTDEVWGVAFSRDGRLASASWDNTVKIWDPATGKVLHTLKGHNDYVWCVAFSNDGRWLASGSGDGRDSTVKIWDAATGEVLHTLAGHTKFIWCVAFSPDGRQLASASVDNTVRIWDPANGKELLIFRGHSDRVRSVAFSPDGQLLASASSDRTIKIWNPGTGKQLLTLRGHSEAVTSVAFSPDGKRLASGGGDHTVRIWDPATGKQVRILQGHAHWIRSVAFSPDGQRLASSSEDKSVKIWDPATGQEQVTLWGHSSDVEIVAFSPDGKWLASSSRDKTLKIWDPANIKSVQKLLTLKGHTASVNNVTFSPDGKQLASAGDNVIIWNPANGQRLYTLNSHATPVGQITYSPDGLRLASASWQDKTIKIWDPGNAKELLTIQADSNGVYSLAFSPDSRWLASGGTDKTITIWDVATGKEGLILTGHNDTVAALAFASDGRLASAARDATIKVWDPATGKELLTLKGHAPGDQRLAFSPDGRQLVSVCGDSPVVMIWDPFSGQELLTLKGHAKKIRRVAFSPNGKRLATASDDKTVKLWDPTTGQDLLTLTGHTEGVSGVAFSPDGWKLASSSWDKTINIWDATPREEAAAQAQLPAVQPKAK